MTKNVSMVFSEDFYTYNFGSFHPLRPVRLELTIKMMESFGLLKNPKLNIINARMATMEEILLVHNKEYTEIVKKYSNKSKLFYKDLPRGNFGLGTMDDPVFDGMYEASSLVVGASIEAANSIINNDDIDHAFNFSGGLHHAAKKLAHGFCICNDAAIAIQKLRLKNQDMKIMYLDIDAHHGDGVQSIFYDDPKVLTVSIHQDGQTLFPGTGALDEIGEKDGKNYSINMPLHPGTYDEPYIDMFRNLIPKIMDAFKPELIVTQLGVDTHYHDPLTMLGLTTTGHEKIYNLIHEYAHKYCEGKWLGLGGGGYLMTVVPRSWTMALGVMLEEEVSNTIPNDWIDFCDGLKLEDEETPYEMRDRNPRLEERLLKDPMFQARIEEKIDENENFIINEVIPNLNKK